MNDDRRPPHLRSVPDVEEVEAPPVIEMQPQPEAQPRAPAPVIGLGNMAQPAQAGVVANVGTHLLAVSATMGTGAGVGYLASGELRGAAIGASAQLALLGLVGAAFGGQRMPIWMRAVYGALGLGGALTSSYLVWTRR